MKKDIKDNDLRESEGCVVSLGSTTGRGRGGGVVGVTLYERIDREETTRLSAKQPWRAIIFFLSPLGPSPFALAPSHSISRWLSPLSPSALLGYLARGGGRAGRRRRENKRTRAGNRIKVIAISLFSTFNPAKKRKKKKQNTNPGGFGEK